MELEKNVGLQMKIDAVSLMLTDVAILRLNDRSTSYESCLTLVLSELVLEHLSLYPAQMQR